MARKKVKLQWISNDAARKATFKKRKKGLMKKVSELSTLCGVNACAIVYSSFEAQPDVWPSPSEAQNVLARFKSLPDMEQSKKMMNQEGFLRQRIAKLKEQVRKQQRENRESEMTQVMYRSLGGEGLQGLGTDDLSDLAWLVDGKMKAIQDRMEELTKVTPQVNTGNEGTNNGAGGSSQGDNLMLQETMEALQRQSWFMEVMDPNENLGYIGDDTVMSYADSVSWSNTLFP